jgi:hypothetical protein
MIGTLCIAFSVWRPNHTPQGMAAKAVTREGYLT